METEIHCTAWCTNSCHVVFAQSRRKMKTQVDRHRIEQEPQKNECMYIEVLWYLRFIFMISKMKYTMYNVEHHPWNKNVLFHWISGIKTMCYFTKSVESKCIISLPECLWFMKVQEMVSIVNSIHLTWSTW